MTMREFREELMSMIEESIELNADFKNYIAYDIYEIKKYDYEGNTLFSDFQDSIGLVTMDGSKPKLVLEFFETKDGTIYCDLREDAKNGKYIVIDSFSNSDFNENEVILQILETIERVA